MKHYKFDKRLHIGALGLVIWKNGRPMAIVEPGKNGSTLKLVLNEPLAVRAVHKCFGENAAVNDEA